MIRVRSADQARELVLRAMERRWRITVGFWEVRKEDHTDPVSGKTTRRPVKVRDPETGKMVDAMVHTVRTFEPFDVNRMSLAEYYDEEWSDTDYFTSMDAHTAEGKPGIRACRFDRVTDITIHKRSPYRMPNAYFIGRVRQHAAEYDGEGWGAVAALTDEALWSLIDEASSPSEAIKTAAVYAVALEVNAT